MREDIRERQNSAWALDRLAAQGLRYRQVKSVENWRLVCVLFVSLLMLTGLALEPIQFSQIATIAVVVLWFVDQMVLAWCAGRMKEEAAAIQEDFDCFVLDMPWPEHLGVARPTGDQVKELVRRANSKGLARQELADWYGEEDIPAEAVAARLHCQRVNCRWDGRLRRDWIWWVRLVVGIVVVVGVTVGAIFGVTLFDVVLGVVAGIRLLAWLLLEQRAQFVAQKRVEDLHGYLSRTEVERGRLTLCDARLVQAAIFEHRRVCPTVPEWFYRIKRETYEGKERG